MCVCTGSVALAACTEEDTGEEGQQEELERLYSTIYQLDAQVYCKVLIMRAESRAYMC